MTHIIKKKTLMVIVIFEKELNRFLCLFTIFSKITQTLVLSLFHWPFQLKNHD